MNKSAIKNFAVRARNRLIEDITQKAYELGITKNEIKDIETFEGGFKIKGLDNSKTYKKYEAKQREKLVSNIREKGFEQVIEEVAYTWFNRFIALRFMEVNEYLPTGVRVLSSVEEGKTEPDIIKEALNIDLDIDKELVYKLIDENDTEDLYKYLIIKQCNQLGEIMPMVFEEISDYTELLLPDNLLAEGSVIRDLVESIEEGDYKDQVEIIGWLYQYYISEKKDEVFADLKKNKKITKENIPAATQLFTPKWIVRYMVENTLGRLWLESHPDDELKAQWKYYLEEAEQDPEVQKKLDELKDPSLNPEDIKVLDPSMGSGHILVYAFDVLYDIYLKANYSERDIPQLILENNLYGLDIDDRAGQLAAFALMMKARSKNRRIFRKRIELNVCSIQESNGIPTEAIQYLVSPKDTAIEKTIRREDIEYLVEIFKDAKEYGSILEIKKIDFDAIDKRVEEIKDGETIDLFEFQHREVILEKMPPLIKQAKIMSDKYDVVCTNPPYMGNRGMDEKLTKYLKINFPDTKGDMSTVFMEMCIRLCSSNGLMAMINIPSWMFLSTYKKLREDIINKNTIINMLHLGRGIFGSDFGTTSFVIKKEYVDKYLGQYRKLFLKQGAVDTIEQKEKWFFENLNQYYNCQDNYKVIEDMPIAYSMSRDVKDIFNKYKPIDNFSVVTNGMFTCNNNYFLKMWYEVNRKKINLQCKNTEEAINNDVKWYPYNKGGEFRKWYGNHEYVINYMNDGREVREYRKDRGQSFSLPGQEYFFRESISWSFVSSSKFGVRYYPKGFIFDIAGSSVFANNTENIFFITAFLCSKIAFEFLLLENPTLNFQAGNVASLPLIENIDVSEKMVINKLCKNNIEISKTNWDSYETSWNFKRHPLLEHQHNNSMVEQSFRSWLEFTSNQFEQLKTNEETLNKKFIEIYGLQNELTPEVEENDITITKADRQTDIKSFISYAVGCMFGRYSLDEEGLIYAGGQFDINRYKTLVPTKDNVLVIADDDYFEDDIVNRFVEFVKVTFGEKTLEENLDYIAETLGKKASETSRQTIRRYFLKDFYTDHVKTYSKRPIYWLFDSGKQNGFKALIYMHRYDSSTVARVRTDYLHKLQKKYEAEVKRLDILLESDLSAREKAAAMKKKDSINKQILECLAYDQVIAHVANQKIDIDLDDGVAVNYDKFQGVQIPQGDGKKPLKANLLAKI
ncbi:BREX-1 system adenine-specific DNA-methyltransferase PglX [Clostridium formicaceticum]|uniref:site-specific DNA-methyltransferase (adenine-specific) n=1 Tax=Clostridium formicaceticum TaxID=1497 RepID=A0AAC9WKW3_9CLOT|nr:BREX-1 system adenine-specific DNA-methyltransferase PglX [Clostridium formicaceticum]AOY75380.1 restriction endonuclease [Clostridium formicaceticum]ARE89835.1 hypothetical protein CLFO_43180 [Clostridium formicaceticum]